MVADAGYRAGSDTPMVSATVKHATLEILLAGYGDSLLVFGTRPPSGTTARSIGSRKMSFNGENQAGGNRREEGGATSATPCFVSPQSQPFALRLKVA